MTGDVLIEQDYKTRSTKTNRHRVHTINRIYFSHFAHDNNLIIDILQSPNDDLYFVPIKYCLFYKIERSNRRYIILYQLSVHILK